MNHGLAQLPSGMPVLPQFEGHYLTILGAQSSRYTHDPAYGVRAAYRHW